MRIQHNISAMNAGRNLRKNTGSLKKNLEKLSSGFRINRSADDAAGLAISESMRASIACLDQAENNASDGISLVQTADGAMQEIHDMLDRMAGLAAQAANGTLTDKEREHIQKEIDQILDEITRIKNETEFNGIPLLQGDEATTTTKPVTLGGLPAWVTSTAQNGGLVPNSYDTDKSAVYIDFSNGFNKSDLLSGDNVGFHTTCCTCTNHYSIKFTDSDTHKTEQSGTHYVISVGIKSATTAEDVVNEIIEACGGNATTPGKMGSPYITNHFTEVTSTTPGVLILYDYRSGQTPTPGSDRGIFAEGVAYDARTVSLGDVELQIGEYESSRMEVDLPNMALSRIGVNGLSVATDASARAAISKIKNGVRYVSGERSRMGAYQNRLEHTHKNLGSTVENLSQSESVIRDADVAEEMMAYTKNNILIQSAQAMLAQSNQVPQGVLQLMQ